jgi:SAM-dependent methyltransferase
MSTTNAEACSCCDARSYAESADWPAEVSRLLFEHLEAYGFAGRSVLEVGCGYGRLAVGAALGGAARVTGVELDGEALDEAEELAADEGLEGVIEWVEGDGAEIELEKHDIVVLDRAICCYEDGECLVASTAAAAGEVYAITVPESRGLRGAWNWLLYTSMGLWDALRGNARVYLYDVAKIEQQIAEAGFRLTTRQRLGKWHLGIYERQH